MVCEPAPRFNVPPTPFMVITPAVISQLFAPSIQVKVPFVMLSVPAVLVSVKSLFNVKTPLPPGAFKVIFFAQLFPPLSNV
jgi:hypothetical protein